MTIPTSGSFTSETIRAEWGGSYPMTSAQVASWAGLSAPWTSEQLRGKSAYDPTPDPVNWPDASAYDFGSASAYTDATITGISGAITLRLSVNSAPGTRKRLSINVGGTQVVNTASVTPTQWDFTVSNGQTVSFVFTANAQLGSKPLDGFWSGTGTVTNVTTGTVLDTFTFDVTAAADESVIS